MFCAAIKLTVVEASVLCCHQVDMVEASVLCCHQVDMVKASVLCCHQVDSGGGKCFVLSSS